MTYNGYYLCDVKFINQSQKLITMSNYIFLAKRNGDSETTYYAISEGRIEQMNLADAYGDYGQKVGHYNAGDYHMGNSVSDATKDCLKALRERFEYNEDTDIVIVNDWGTDDFYVEPGCIGDDDEKKMNEFIAAWREENENCTGCEGFTYWDGHNWKSIITSCDIDDAVTHEIVDDEELVAELNEAIDEVELTETSAGIRSGNANGYCVIDSCWQGTWEAYSLTPADVAEEAEDEY